MKRNGLGTVLISTGLLLVAGAIGLAGYNLWSEQQAAVSAQSALEVLTQQIAAPPQESQKPQEVPQAPQVDDREPATVPTTGEEPAETVPPQTEPIPEYIANPYMEMPKTQIDGVDYIGYLELPTLGLTLPVINESTENNLRLAPCRFFGSAYLNNFVIGAHNYATHFGGIGGLAFGDLVIFTDMDGNVFVYEVADFEILQPYEGDYLCNGEWDLSLYTCTMGGQSRITIRCEQIGVNTIKNSSAF